MAVNFRSRNQILTAKVESAAGTEESPTVSANAIKAKFPIPWAADFQAQQTNYTQGSLSESAPIISGGGVMVRPGCYLKGAGTGGTAPEFGPLLRACGMSETLTAADVTGTAQAGAASTITLAAGASAVDNAYRGMVITITSNTGSGQTNLIKSYVGSTKVATVAVAWTVTPDATSVYAIKASALYRPVSTALETITAHIYQRHNDGSSQALKRRLVGGAGTFQLALQALGLCAIDFSIVGLLPAAPAMVSDPGTATYGSTDPEPFMNAQAYLGGVRVQFTDFGYDHGAQADRFPDPSATYGYDIAQILGRAPTGRITPALVPTGTYDPFADWIASTQRDLWLNWGSAAGKRVSIYLPAIRYTGAEPTDLRGYAGQSLPFRSVSPDLEAIICIH